MANWTSMRDRIWGYLSPRKLTAPGSVKNDPLRKVSTGRITKLDARTQSLSPTLQHYRKYRNLDEFVKEEYEDEIEEDMEVDSDGSGDPVDEDDLEQEMDGMALSPKREQTSSVTDDDEATDDSGEEEEDDPDLLDEEEEGDLDSLDGEEADDSDAVDEEEGDDSDTPGGEEEDALDSLDGEEDDELDSLEGEEEEKVAFFRERVAHATADDPEYADWTQSELDLHNRLNDRGVDPMLYSVWKLDFPTMPEAVFTKEKDEALIKSLVGSEFRGSKALVDLLAIGSRARDRVFTRRDPAQILTKQIRSYITWSFKDAGLVQNAYIPIVTVIPALGSQTAQDAVDRIQLRLRHLSAQYRDLWESQPEVFKAEALPTLYGIVIAQTVMAFVTYNASHEEGDVRSLAVFNWREAGQDVWNALAVAIMAVQAREWLINLDPVKDRTALNSKDSSDDDK